VQGPGADTAPTQRRPEINFMSQALTVVIRRRWRLSQRTLR